MKDWRFIQYEKQLRRDAFEKHLEETMDEKRLNKLEARIAELAQELYREDGHSGNIYKKASFQTLLYYENKALDKIRLKEKDDLKLREIYGEKEEK